MSILKLIPRFRNLDRDLQILRDREQWSREQIENWQLERLNLLWRQSRRDVPYYRNLAKTHNLPEQFASTAEFSRSMPRLKKTTVRESRFELLSEVRRPGRWKMTGGSTGDPTRVFWAKDSHRESLRGKYCFLQSHGVDPLDSMAYLWGHSASFERGLRGWISRAEQWITDRLRKRLRLSAYRTGPEELRRYVRQIQQFRPTSLYGYSGALCLLSHAARESGASFPGLKAVIMTAEPVLPPQKRRVEAAFHVPAVAEYGSVECGFLAGEAPDRTLRVREDCVLIEAEPNGLGAYDLLITVLNNPAFPLIRYEIGDLTDAPLSRPEKGFARLHSVLGRSNDYVVTLQGRRLHPITFMDCLESMVPELGRFHVHQRADAGLTLEVETSAVKADPRWRDQLQRRLVDLTEGLPVEIKTVNCVTRTAAGKRRFITSDLANEVC